MKPVGDRASRLRALTIGSRLTLCFILIILAMLAGNAVLIWQFQQTQWQAERLAGVDQQLITVLQAHASLMTFYERLDALARSEDRILLLEQVETIHSALLQETQRSRTALSLVPTDVQVDPILLPTLLAIQRELPAQLEAMAILAKSGDWDAVRLRLANQVRPLESRSSALVENIDGEVSEARTQAVSNIRAAQRRIVLIVPMTAAITLLFAAFLGVVITQSITQPLGRLVEGSAALARGDFSHRVPGAGNDEIARLGAVFNDMIVRLQELYRELQSRETYLAEAQRLSHTGSFGWNPRNDEIYWSEQTFRIFEFEPNAEVNVNAILERTHPEDRPALQHAFEGASRDETPFDLEHRLLMPDGSVKYLRVVGRPSSDEEDRGEFVGAVTDITERKRADQEREKLRQTLADLAHITRVTTMGELTASLAHEIKQPIAAAVTDAKTCLRWLARDEPELEEARDAAARAIKDVMRASEIISRIGSLFKKGASQRELLDVNEVIHEMMVLLRSEASRYSISIYSQLDDNLPQVMADRVQLQQVLMNLMLNGIEAMKDSCPPGELTIGSRRENCQLVISVRDTGVGLPAGQAEQVFEAFFTTKPQGTGMGLTISRSIVESHGGRLSVSTSGSATTFQFTLPSEISAHQSV